MGEYNRIVNLESEEKAKDHKDVGKEILKPVQVLSGVFFEDK